MLILTQSTIKDWTRCPRKWWLAHYRELRKRAEYRSPLVLGNLVHDALAEWYGSEVSSPFDVIDRESARLLEEHPEALEKITDDVELARIMLEGYMEWLEETGADADFVSVEPERSLVVELKPNVVLMGKLDGRVELRDGWRAFLEHKTVGNFTDLPSYAQFDRQLLTYHLLEHMEWLRKAEEDDSVPAEPMTDGAILNMLRKVKRSARAKPPFFERVEIRHNIHELRNHWRHVMTVVREIETAILALDAGTDHHDVVVPVPTADCRWSCAFYDICPMFDDDSDVESVIEALYERGDPLERYRSPSESEV